MMPLEDSMPKVPNKALMIRKLKQAQKRLLDAEMALLQAVDSAEESRSQGSATRSILLSVQDSHFRLNSLLGNLTEE